MNKLNEEKLKKLTNNLWSENEEIQILKQQIQVLQNEISLNFGASEKNVEVLDLQSKLERLEESSAQEISELKTQLQELKQKNLQLTESLEYVKEEKIIDETLIQATTTNIKTDSMETSLIMETELEVKILFFFLYSFFYI